MIPVETISSAQQPIQEQMPNYDNDESIETVA
jgi:hypothetical protein